MPRTFTLQQLLIVMTLICVACSLVAVFPHTAAATGMTLSYFLPGIVVGGVLSLLSSHPSRAWALSFLGSLGGFMFVPRNLWIWGDYNLIYWEIYRRDFLSIATYTTAGACLGAVAAVVFFPRWRRPPRA